MGKDKNIKHRWIDFLVDELEDLTEALFDLIEMAEKEFKKR